jgi:RNA polymerase sigma-70 factor (ECF subfamily)
MEVSMTQRLHDLPTRYSLLSRLQDWEDQESWKEFFDTYWQLIYAVAVKSGLTDSEAQDVIQETVVSVAKHIHKFKRDRALGSFKSWLRNIIRWRIADQLKKRTPGLLPSSGAGSDAEAHSRIKDVPDLTAAAALEKLWDEEWQNNLLTTAFERVKRQVKEEHYLAFDFYVNRKWPVRKVARKLGISAGQVYLVKHRISALIKKEIRALEKEPI